MKKISILVVTFLLIFLVGCVESGGNNIILNELSIPVITKYENNTVYWNSVSNADGYVVKINNVEYIINDLFYTVSFDETQEFTFAIKAIGRSNYNNDSKWSETKTYVYNKKDINVDSDNKKLPVPVIVSYEDNTLEWNNVDGAIGYCLDINGEQITTNLTKYKFSFENSCVFTVKLKALGDEEYKTEDSNWTALSKYNFELKATIEKEVLDKIMEYGIGYGYDFINDPYFDSNYKKTISSILDLDKIATFATVKDSAATGKTQEMHFEYSLKDFLLNMDASYKSEVNGVVPLKGFNIGMKNSLEFAGKFNYESYVGGVFINYYIEQKYKQYDLYDYGSIEKLSKYLSEDFMNVINRNSLTLKDKTDRELAKYIVDTYGTHLVIGVITGGRLEYFYGAITKDYNIETELRTYLSQFSGVEIKDLLELGTNNTIGLNLKESMKSGKSFFDDKLIVYGGNEDEYKKTINVANVASQYDLWKLTINDETVKTIGVSNNGLISLADLIYFINPKLADEVVKIIDEMKNEDYLAKFDEYEYAKGSYSNPYEASNADELINLLNNTNESNKEGAYIKLTNDIDFSSKGKYNRAIISKLYANILGNDKKITGINMTLQGQSNGKYGLFEEIAEGASISNINFESNKLEYNSEDKLNCTYSVGFVCGINNGKIENINISKSSIKIDIGSVNDAYNNICYSGLICGVNNKTIVNCNVENSSVYTKADTKGDENWTTYTAKSYVGGICGIANSNSSIANCKVTLTQINASAQGCFSASIIGGWWSAQLDAYAGGIVGEAINSSITNSIFMDNSISASATGAADDCQRSSEGDICGKNTSSIIS